MPDVYEGDRPYIFACYAHADRDAALPIISVLVDEGYRVWYDDGIELGEEYPAYLADHVHDCACFVMFISRASLGSVWCNNEVNYALNLGKSVLPVYLEDVELPRALQMRLGVLQALFWHKYETDEEFNEGLFAVKMLDSCLTEEGRIERGVKARASLALEEHSIKNTERQSNGDETKSHNSKEKCVDAKQDGSKCIDRRQKKHCVISL